MICAHDVQRVACEFLVADTDWGPLAAFAMVLAIGVAAAIAIGFWLRR